MAEEGAISISYRLPTVPVVINLHVPGCVLFTSLDGVNVNDPAVNGRNYAQSHVLIRKEARGAILIVPDRCFEY